MAVQPLVVRYPNRMVVIYLEGAVPCAQTLRTPPSRTATASAMRPPPPPVRNAASVTASGVGSYYRVVRYHAMSFR